MSGAPDSDVFMSRVEALTNGGPPPLSPLAAGILVAVDMGIADSRGFARALGVEHALVLREIALLSDADGLITVTGRHPKTLRTALELSDRGVALLKERCGPVGPAGAIT
jgi:hypothetical protein